MEDLTHVVTSAPRKRNYTQLGDAYTFDVPFSLIAEQFKVGDRFTYRQKIYEISIIYDNQNTPN